MKLWKLTFLLVCFVTIGVYGQKGKELLIGGGGGFTSVWIMNQNFYGEPEVNYAPKAGYAGFVTLGYDFDGHAAIATEIQYSLQGQKYSDKQSIDGVKYDVDRNIDLSYINIPLLFRYSFGTGSTRFRVLLGPQYSMLQKAEQSYLRDGKKLGTKATDLDGNEFVTDADDITDRFESTDFSILMDVGADIRLSDPLFLSAGFRGQYGFKDINAPAYRINDLDGEYSPSHNVWGGLYVGLIYRVDVEKYDQRSF
ncbi:MAG: hypothetical protein Kow00127_22070 [Bacteroidales bacterium]